MKNKKYIALSPDGFTLTPEPKEHDSIDGVREEVVEWAKRYKDQGYYRNNRMEKIPYDEIIEWCDYKEI